MGHGGAALLGAAGFAAALVLSGCGAGGAAKAGTSAPSSAPAAGVPSGSGAAVSGTFQITSGSSASYTAHETFLQQNLPHAPVGTTTGVTGDVVLASGVLRGGTVRVDLTGLHTDTAMRDRRVQQTLDTATYPAATFAITGEAAGSPRVTTGATADVQVRGNLTIHGVTKPEVWDVAITVGGATLHAVAAPLALDMTTFGVQPPNIAGFVAVEDGIQLAADITATKA